MSTLPRFLTTEFLQLSLKNYLKCDVKVLKICNSNLGSLGSNFCSDIFRIAVIYTVDKSDKNKKLSMIVKMFPEDVNTAEIINTLKIFDNELGVYGEVIPAMYNLDYQCKVTPKPIFISSTPIPILLLEDLTPSGYQKIESLRGLDLKHCLLVTKTLAYFHAASVALYEKEPDLIKKYKTGMYFNNPVCLDFISVGFSSLIELCQETPDLQKYVKKMSFEKILQKLFLSVEENKNFNVLNHGDPWFSNFLFYYDSNGNLVDMILLDFQCAKFGSPAMDLHYFWTVNPNLEVKKTSLDQVLTFYYKCLNKNLLKLHVNVAVPTIEEFKKDFYSKSIYGFATTIYTLPLLKAKAKPNAPLFDYMNFSGEGSYRYSCFRSKLYLDDIKILLPFYDSVGVFD